MVTSRTGTAKWKNLRRRVIHTAKTQGLTHCPRCGVWLDYDVGRRPNSAEVDHVVPHAHGGRDAVENCQVLCRRCNQSAGAKSPRRGTGRRRVTVQTIEF